MSSARTSKLNRLLFALILTFLAIPTASILLRGFYSSIYYKQTIQPNLQLNTDVLWFFMKENILGEINKFQAYWNKKTNLPIVSIYSDESSIQTLNSDLPYSGKAAYHPGYIDMHDGEEPYEMSFRYRGDMPYHWLHEKKSYRIKLADYSTFKGAKVFNLVHTPARDHIADWISYDMSKQLGILTPEYFPVRVYLNNQDNGVHFYLEQIDENFLRKNNRMPGSLYFGDRKYKEYYSNFYNATISAVDEHRVHLLWKDHRLWDKSSSRNQESKNYREDIKFFIKASNQDDAITFYHDFKNYFDSKSYYHYFALDVIFGTPHHDTFHNHKLYFDPYKGKFEPIQWDIRFWLNRYKIKDYSYYSLLDQISKNPILEYERDLVAYEIMNKYSSELILNEIKKKASALYEDIFSDPYRKAPQRHELFSYVINQHFTEEEYNASVANLITNYHDRSLFLSGLYADSRAEYKATNNKGSLVITLSISGNSPIIFDPKKYLISNSNSSVKIFVNHNNKKVELPSNVDLILYPGRRQVNAPWYDPDSNNNDSAMVSSYGRQRLDPSPLHYTFTIEGDIGPEEITKRDFSATNAITNEPILVKSVDKLAATKNTISVHPWDINFPLDADEEIVKLSGDIIISETTVYESDNNVIIEKGTNFYVSPEKSLIFYGRVTAKGTQDEPIMFTRADKDKPWGSLVIHGEGASGSILNNIIVSGGSILSHNLVSYPGQFNIHEVNAFSLKNCKVSENSIGDDSLHIAYSKGTIENCEFSNSHLDAVDIDISEVKVSNSTFTNSGNDGLDLMNSTVYLNASTLNNNGDKCISIGEKTEATIQNISLKSCLTGLAIKDESTVTLDTVKFLGGTTKAISLYQKNPRYGKGGTVSGTNIYGITRDDISVSENSTNNIKNGEFKALNRSQQEQIK